ncbi:hypothetical protein HMPREF0758_0081 [Serratia odorifera DSM 4582]|uniref:Uncharacterized protein n=1 Tax=Serratia odorifera DSM 4582 TaxID=667129 RepID=D4DVY1_SEROD|nr:hypothetical protein HMPREF0758_0081 [Serratia odorifera DSM 4582]
MINVTTIARQNTVTAISDRFFGKLGIGNLIQLITWDKIIRTQD